MRLETMMRSGVVLLNRIMLVYPNNSTDSNGGLDLRFHSSNSILIPCYGLIVRCSMYTRFVTGDKVVHFGSLANF